MSRCPAVLKLLLVTCVAVSAPSLPGSAAAAEAGRSEPEAKVRFSAERRLPPGASAVPTEPYAAALDMMRGLPLYSTAAQTFLRADTSPVPQQPNLGTWTPLGPGNIGGRTRALLIDPHTTAPNYTLYAAG